MTSIQAVEIATYKTTCDLGSARDMAAFSAATKSADRKAARQARKGNTESTWHADFNAKYAALAN